jgi:hypothetical protein
VLQLAVTTAAFPGESLYVAGVPVGVQRAAFSVLAVVGRLLGYESTHSRDGGER